MARKGYQGPLPSSDFRKQVATEVLTPFTDIISGEFAASVSRPLGIARFKGRVTNVILPLNRAIPRGLLTEAANSPEIISVKGVKTSVATCFLKSEEGSGP